MGKVNYRKGDGVIEILVTDHTGAKELNFKANHSDKKAHREIAKTLSSKYGINLCYHLEDKYFDF